MTTVEEIKEQQNTPTPLFLFECAMPSGTMEYWSTHRVTVDGITYRARVLGHNLFELKLASDDGADGSSRISLTLANADSNFSELEGTAGFRGSQLKVKFVFFDLREGIASCDTRVLFRGIAGRPDEITETTLRITFTNRLSLQRVSIPSIRIQKRCPWVFPSSEAQRLEAVDGGAKGMFSRVYRCGYSAGVAGGCGNLDSTGKPFYVCTGTRADCVERGMFDKDASGATTRRFGGVEFVPSTIAVRSYGEKEWHSSAVQSNDAKYNDVVPVVYGTAWYGPPVVFSRNDGNLTRMEILLGSGKMERVLKVVVNGVEIPEAVIGTNMTATGWYSVVSTGGREGAFNPDFTDGSGKPEGDPYGSMTMMSVVVPNRVATGESLPRIQVLAQGKKLERFSEDGSPAGQVSTNNPAWILLDLLRSSGWEMADIDLATFARTAAYFEEPVTMKDLHGNDTSRPRMQANVALQRRRSAADVVRGIRTCAAAFLSYGADGRLQLRAEGSLSDQQAAKPAGSNSLEKLAGGWPAYEFSDSSRPFSGILRRDNGDPYFRIWSRSPAETTNRLSLEFQDEFNEYQQDSLSLVHVEDVNLTGQEVGGALAALGVPNFDQASRVLGLALRKSVEGNCYVEFGTSVRGFGLTPGDIIAVTYSKAGFDRTPFRIQRIAPATNYRTAVITAQLHDDTWYSADAMSHPGGGRNGAGSGRLPRPLVGTEIGDDGRSRFGITEKVNETSDGALSVTLTAAFKAPRASITWTAGVPILSLTPEVRDGDGSVPEGVYYYVLTAVDANGSESPCSYSVRARVKPGLTARITLRELSFPPNAVSFNVYRGPDPGSVLLLGRALAISGEFVDDGIMLPEPSSPPDPNYDHANFYWRLEVEPEAPVTAHSANTIGCDDLSMTANEFRGSVVRITSGKGAGQERAVSANTDKLLTVTPPWVIEPDDTSRFAVAEGSWKFGALTVDGPAQFDVPNRINATVQISGRAANVLDEECAGELSPLTRWTIGGGGTAGDADIPPEPVFGLYTNGQGRLDIMSVGFRETGNTRTITAGTLVLWYEDELNPATPVPMAAPILADDTTLKLSKPGTALPGDVIVVGSEVMTVADVVPDGMQYDVLRASHGSEAVQHDVESVVHLKRRTEVLPFLAGFFGSPGSGSYTHALAMPDACIMAADFFVTNRRGPSPVSRLSYTSSSDGGLRTLSGGQYSIQVDGFITVQAQAAPAVVVDGTHAVRDITALVRSAPIGGAVEIQIYQDDEPWGSRVIVPNRSTSSDAIAGRGLPPLRAGAKVTVEVVSVPRGEGTFPGRDLTVSICM